MAVLDRFYCICLHIRFSSLAALIMQQSMATCSSNWNALHVFMLPLQASGSLGTLLLGLKNASVIHDQNMSSSVGAVNKLSRDM